MLTADALAAIAPTLLTGRRVAVLGAGGGLGAAVAAAARAGGAQVLGLDPRARFDGLDALYRYDPADPGAAQALAAALPDGLEALVLMPDLSGLDPAAVLDQGCALPLALAQALAPRMAPGGAIVVRGATGPDRAAHLAAIRAARALRPGQGTAFAERWGLLAEPARAPLLAGWALGAWAMARATAWPGLRVNAVAPAAPDGRLPPATAAAAGMDQATGPALAARAALFLISPLSQGLTGACLAADGGMAAQMHAVAEGL